MGGDCAAKYVKAAGYVPFPTVASRHVALRKARLHGPKSGSASHRIIVIPRKPRKFNSHRSVGKPRSNHLAPPNRPKTIPVKRLSPNLFTSASKKDA